MSMMFIEVDGNLISTEAVLAKRKAKKAEAKTEKTKEIKKPSIKEKLAKDSI